MVYKNLCGLECYDTSVPLLGASDAPVLFPGHAAKHISAAPLPRFRKTAGPQRLRKRYFSSGVLGNVCRSSFDIFVPKKPICMPV